MKQIKFTRIKDTDKFDLYIDKKPVKSNITMDEVLAIIAKTEEREISERQK